MYVKAQRKCIYCTCNKYAIYLCFQIMTRIYDLIGLNPKHISKG